MRTSNHSARERILATATDLFSREGYRAVGTDTIIERSGVAKMTLYRHFAAKNELICAYIEQTIEKFWASVEQVVNEHPDSPREQLVKIFEMQAADVADPTFCGCSCLHAAVEFPEPDHPAHKLAYQHKQDVRARFCDLARQAGARQPEVLADQLLMLMNGLLMQGRMQGPTDMSLPVVQAAKALIDVQLAR
ncbi:TetR family transcriptional regulator [Reticulibacter mediterranei]|uniref:TetR family transcriptional regulator n=1 Tax=Reticulibacter mediterranei TaxID=2778369 RepID=A0A8J3N5A6_9CHLR|nr:TetR/AcrR family transcriptional regulator [Reticulibacter mediterranei]GHO99067.1 TetR family transcriptional regulator [Reticulibacter mediterranei]